MIQCKIELYLFIFNKLNNNNLSGLCKLKLMESKKKLMFFYYIIRKLHAKLKITKLRVLLRLLNIPKAWGYLSSEIWIVVLIFVIVLILFIV